MRTKHKKQETLTSKQKLFVSEYLVDRNAKQAAIRAGYSAKTAEVQGSRLLSKAKVKALVEKKTAKLIEKTEMTAQRAMEEVMAIATSNVRDIIDFDPVTREFSFKSADEVPPEFWKAAQEVTVFETPNGNGTAYKIKMHPKMTALKLEYERLNLIKSPTTTTTNNNLYISMLDYNKALRRIGEKEINAEDIEG